MFVANEKRLLYTLVTDGEIPLEEHTQYLRIGNRQYVKV